MSLSSLVIALKPLPPVSEILQAIENIQVTLLKLLSITVRKADDGDEVEEDDDEIGGLVDDWERQYVQSWLVRVASKATEVMEEFGEEVDDVYEAWEQVADATSKLVGLLSGGVALSEPFSRTFTFASTLGSPITVEIRDAALSYAAIGAQTWNAAPLLCKRLCGSPETFFPQLTNFSSIPIEAPVPVKFQSVLNQTLEIDTPPYTRPSSPNSSFKPLATRRPLRILELGSGTGLVGLIAAAVIAQLLQSSSSDQSGGTCVELILTDYHGDVLENLSHNLNTNADLFKLRSDCKSMLRVSVEALDWRYPEQNLVDGKFDIVLGSDLVYETQHAWWASSMIKRYLRQPISTSSTLSSISSGLPPHKIGSPWTPPWTPLPSRPGTPYTVDTLSHSDVDLVDDSSTQAFEPIFHLLLPLRPTFVKESRAVHDAFGGTLYPELCASPPSGGTAALPDHDCSWESRGERDAKAKTTQGGNNDEGKKEGRSVIIEPMIQEEDSKCEVKPEKLKLQIKTYAREQGITFGQGCSDYQYLTIGWA